MCYRSCLYLCAIQLCLGWVVVRLGATVVSCVPWASEADVILGVYRFFERVVRGELKAFSPGPCLACVWKAGYLQAQAGCYLFRSIGIENVLPRPRLTLWFGFSSMPIARSARACFLSMFARSSRRCTSSCSMYS